MNPVHALAADPEAPIAGDQPMLTIDGLEDSVLKITLNGLIVCPPRSAGRDLDRFWAYEDLRDLTVSAYGSIGVIRATVRSTGTELPLLLLEPQQIVAARRTLEVVWNRIGRRTEGSAA
jgi:hypothetical protein